MLFPDTLTPRHHVTLVCVGDALVDLVVRVEGLPRRGRTTWGPPPVRVAGGTAANVAAGLAHLGQRTAFVGRLGDDDNGRFLTEDLRGRGVDVAGAAPDAEAGTGVAISLVEPDGERTFLACALGAAQTRLADEDLAIWRERAPGAVFLTGLLLLEEPARGRLSAEAYDGALGDLERALPAAIEAVLEPAMTELLAAAAAGLAGQRHLIFVGSGAARAAALVGAAKMHETVRRHALAVNAEEFLHLIGFACGAADGVVIVAPTGAAERERQVAEYAARQGARVVSLVRGGLADGWGDGLVAPLPTDGLSPWSGALAAMTGLHVLAERFSLLAGTNPDRPDTVDLDYVLGLLYTAPLEGW